MVPSSSNNYFFITRVTPLSYLPSLEDTDIQTYKLTKTINHEREGERERETHTHTHTTDRQTERKKEGRKEVRKE